MDTAVLISIKINHKGHKEDYKKNTKLCKSIKFTHYHN
jgi:hypothetical protein